MMQAKTKAIALYDRDFVAWADEQALLLEQKRWDELDLVNLVEEVRDLGRRERDALESQLIRLLMHLLNPVLKVHTETIFYECYLEAREIAADETGLPEQVFPLECPYFLEQVLDRDFFPPAIEVAGNDQK